MGKKMMVFLRKNKHYLQSFYLIVLSAVLLMAVIAYLNHSLGWFTSNKNVTADHISIRAYDDSEFKVEGFTIYKYEFNPETFMYKFYSGDDATLNAYDTIFTSRNEKNAVIIKIDVTGLDAGSKFRLNFCCTDDTSDLDHVSDMIYFRAGVLNLAGSDEDHQKILSEEEIYNEATADLKTDGHADTLFISEKNGTIEAKKTEVLSEVLTMTEGGSIYVLLDYYPGVIKNQGMAFDGESGTGNTKTYPGDISSIEIIKE